MQVRAFEYVEAGPRLALARLIADVGGRPASTESPPTLLAVGERAHRLPAIVDPGGWGRELAEGRRRWRLAFPLPLDAVDDPSMTFLLELPDSLLLGLPHPELRRLRASSDAANWAAGGRVSMVAAMLACGAIALGAQAPEAVAQETGAAVVVTADCPPSGQLEDGSACAVPSADCPPEGRLPDGTPCVPAPPPSDPVEAPTDRGAGTTTPPAGSGSEEETSAPAPPPPAPAPQQAPAKAETDEKPDAEGGETEARGDRSARAKRLERRAARDRRAEMRQRERHAAKRERKRQARAERREARAERRAAERREARAERREALRTIEAGGKGSSGPVTVPGLAVADPPEPPGYLKPIYKAAGRKHGVPWQVLAAINEIETQYGRLQGPSPAGAIGWMQFMPASWKAFGVDADGDGRRNPHDPRDAIFAAAHYLEEHGARKDLPRAIWHYNHAEWYVQAVLLRAREMRWRDPRVTKLLRLRRWQLERKVLADERIEIYACGREDIEKHRIDRRVLLTLQFLADAGFHPTVSSLQCGRNGIYTKSGNVSHHVVGAAVDISAINGVPIMGNQGAGSVTESVVRRLLTLRGIMAADQIISLIEVRGAPSTIAMGDHADHIHIGFRPRRDVRAVKERLRRLRERREREFAAPSRRPSGIFRSMR